MSEQPQRRICLLPTFWIDAGTPNLAEMAKAPRLREDSLPESQF